MYLPSQFAQTDRAALHALMAALERNLYASSAAPSPRCAAVASYVRRETAALLAQPTEQLLAGTIRFGAPPQAGEGE